MITDEDGFKFRAFVILSLYIATWDLPSRWKEILLRTVKSPTPPEETSNRKGDQSSDVHAGGLDGGGITP